MTPLGKYSLLDLCLTCLGAVALRYSPRLNRTALKPGRRPGEIAPFLNMSIFVSSFLFFFAALELLLR